MVLRAVGAEPVIAAVRVAAVDLGALGAGVVPAVRVAEAAMVAVTVGAGGIASRRAATSG